jgi:hypothetical protein
MEVHGPAMLGDCAAPSSSLPGLTRQSMRLHGPRGAQYELSRRHSLSMDARVVGERSDAVLRTAMPAHDKLGNTDFAKRNPWQTTGPVPDFVFA